MTVLNIEEEDLAVEILDRDNPRSLLNILPPKIKDAALKVARDDWFKSESVIIKNADPDYSDKCIRMNFWQAYAKAHDTGKNINVNHIVAGVTTKNYFYHVIEENRQKLIYYLTPPKSYDVKQRQLLEESLDKLRSVVTSSIYNEKTITKTKEDGSQEHVTVKTVNTSLVSEIRRITEMLQDRVHGTLVQKLAVKTQSQAPVAVPKAGEAAPEQQIDGLLQDIERQLAALPPAESQVQTLEGEATDITE